MKRLICVECGQEHLTRFGNPACTSHKKPITAAEEAKLAARFNRAPRPERGVEPCTNPPVHGSKICTVHGGTTKQAKSAATRNLSRARAEQAVATYGLARDIEPHEAILEEIARTNGHVHWLAQVVADLQKDDLTWGVTSHESGYGAEGPIDKVTHTAAVNAWLGLYQAERKHLVDVCKTAIQVGIAEQQVQLAEQQGQLVVRILQGVFGDPELGLSPAQASAARKVASRHLRLVDGGAA